LQFILGDKRGQTESASESIVHDYFSGLKIAFLQFYLPAYLLLFATISAFSQRPAQSFFPFFD
jgi:hypothetical protein